MYAWSRRNCSSIYSKNTRERNNCGTPEKNQLMKQRVDASLLFVLLRIRYDKSKGGVMMILVIEDDVLMNKGICHALEKEGHEVKSSKSYEEGLKLAIEDKPSLILLDINLKGKSGIELCKEIRKACEVPIIFITARDTEQDMIEGFDAGCDDYMAKPFSLVILKRKVEAMLRRVVKVDEDVLRDGCLVVDYKKKSVAKDGQILKFTATEYKILETLSKNKGQVLTREQLLEKLWDIDGNFIEENTLSVHIRRLRMKLEDDPKNPRWIITVFGIGYTWGE